MEQTECFETSAYKIRTPGNYPKESIQQNIFSFPVAVKNSIKLGPLVFLLYMFVNTENIMNRPVHTKPYLYVHPSS